MSRKEFHDVMGFEDAKKKYFGAISLGTCGEEKIDISLALGRVLSRDIEARIDVPPFDRSSKDGYAVVARDTFYADEEHPARLKLNDEKIPAGAYPKAEVVSGFASEIATGAMIPRGANAVVMVENTNIEGGEVLVYAPATPGLDIMHAGSDMMQGEILMHAGTQMTAKETSVLAAQGIRDLLVYKKPRVGVFSTGDEIIPVGGNLSPGKIYDTNSRVVCDFCRENGAEAEYLGIAADSEDEIRGMLKKALYNSDIVILSGGTSAGTGDICYRIIEELGRIVVHGVAVKPGKPIVLGVVEGKPVVVLPGFPASAAVMFFLFVKPMVRLKAGLLEEKGYDKVNATVPVRINSDKGKHELVLVNLVRQGNSDKYSAYPIFKSSGSITMFAFADGFIEIPEDTECVFKDSAVEVNSFSLKVADINFIGSHCVMLEPAILMLRKRGFFSKVMHVGSTAGLEACKREEADIAGTHLLDAKSNEYNTAFMPKNTVLVRGYIREQGILYRGEGNDGKKGLADFAWDRKLRMVNRNKGSGTRVLLDMLLAKLGAKGKDITGYEVESNTHNGVAAAVALKKADWGLAIRTVADKYGLEFIPLRDEHYDFCIPRPKLGKKGVKEFLKVLKSKEFHGILLESPGIKVPDNIGEIIWEG